MLGILQCESFAVYAVYSAVLIPHSDSSRLRSDQGITTHLYT